MDCQELVELVTDYSEGALDDSTRARFEGHVDGCEGCSIHIEQMRTTISVVRGIDALERRPEVEIGRASCRERASNEVAAGAMAARATSGICGRGSGSCGV